MHVYMYTYIHVHLCTCVYTHTYICAYVCVRIYLHTHLYICFVKTFPSFILILSFIWLHCSFVQHCGWHLMSFRPAIYTNKADLTWHDLTSTAKGHTAYSCFVNHHIHFRVIHFCKIPWCITGKKLWHFGV